MTDFIFVYITVSSKSEAGDIAKAIVADRLAACANILPQMTSVYHWDGKIAEAEEAVVIFKTRSALYPALETRVKELHSYKTPCIVAFPISAGYVSFLDWLAVESKP